MPKGYAAAYKWMALRLNGDPARSLAARQDVENYLKLYGLGQKDAKDAPLMLGLFYAQAGRFREARPFLETAAAADNNPMTLLRLADVCRMLNDKDEATRHLRKRRRRPRPGRRRAR